MATTANPSRDDFAALLEQTARSGGRLRGPRRDGHRHRHRERPRSHRRRPRSPKAACRCANSPRRARRPISRSATKSKSMSTASRTPMAKRCCSRDRARREAAWDKLEKPNSPKSAPCRGRDLRPRQGRLHRRPFGGAVAFLPGSQVDIRPVRDVTPLMDIPQPFQILKMDRTPRQHRRVAPRDARRDPRRAAHRASSRRWPRARSSTAWSRTSPITVPSSTWAASTACSTSPISATSASTTRARCINIGDTVQACRSSASTATRSASRWA